MLRRCVLGAALSTISAVSAQLWTHLRFGGTDHPVNIVLRNLPEDDLSATTAPPVNASYFNAAILDHFGGLGVEKKIWSQRFYIDDR